MGSDPIERIKDEIDIVEYIGRFVSLRKGGKDHVGYVRFSTRRRRRSRSSQTKNSFIVSDVKPLEM